MRWRSLACSANGGGHMATARSQALHSSRPLAIGGLPPSTIPYSVSLPPDSSEPTRFNAPQRKRERENGGSKEEGNAMSKRRNARKEPARRERERREMCTRFPQVRWARSNSLLGRLCSYSLLIPMILFQRCILVTAIVIKFDGLSLIGLYLLLLISSVRLLSMRSFIGGLLWDLIFYFANSPFAIFR